MNVRALELVRAHCDIESRLRAIPPSARVRGLAFQPLKTVLVSAGKIEPYFSLFGPDPHNSMALYPLGEYMLRLACSAAILLSPERVHEGIHEISRENARGFATSMLGKVLIRLLSHDPVKLSEQGLAMRRQTCHWGHWELVRHGPREIEMLYYDEYLWIEHAMAGAAQGTFEACGVTPTLRTTLRNRWNGSTYVTW